VILTALLVRQVVLIVVLLEPLQVVQHRVIRVVLVNTMINKDNLVANYVMLENTMINKDNLVAKQ
jgi:hypothetical protein